jgi:hypothetical protein
VNFVWSVVGMNAKMSSGHANGFQNNFNFNILTMCEKQCMKVEMKTSNMGYEVCPQMQYCSYNWFI